MSSERFERAGFPLRKLVFSLRSLDKCAFRVLNARKYLSKLRNEKTNFLRGNPARSKRSEDTYMRLLARIRTFV